MSLRGWMVDASTSAIAVVRTTAAACRRWRARSIVKSPPTSSARRRRFVNPLPVMSPEIPWPLSMTSIGEVVFDLDVDGQRGGVGMSNGVADSFSHNGFRVIGQARHRPPTMGPTIWTVVRSSGLENWAIASSSRCRSRVVPDLALCRSKMAVRIS